MYLQKNRVRFTATLIFSFALGVGVGTLSYFKLTPWSKENPVQKIHIITSGPLFSPSLIEILENALKIDLTVITTTSTSEFLAYVQRDLEKVDLLVPKSGEVEPLMNQQLLAPIDLRRLSNHNNISPDFLSQTLLLFNSSNSSQLIPLQWGFTGILYDRTKISQTITSWADLWEIPELKEKMAISVQPEEILNLLNLPFHLANSQPHKGHLTDLQESVLDQLLEWVLVESDPLTKLSAGEVYAVQTTNGKAARLADRFQFIIPNDRVSLWIQSIAMTPKGSSNSLSYALINLLLKAENAKLLVDLNEEATTNGQLDGEAISEFQKARYLRKIPLPAMELMPFRGKLGLAWEALIRARIHQKQASL